MRFLLLLAVAGCAPESDCAAPADLRVSLSEAIDGDFRLAWSTGDSEGPCAADGDGWRCELPEAGLVGLHLTGATTGDCVSPVSGYTEVEVASLDGTCSVTDQVSIAPRLHESCECDPWSVAVMIPEGAMADTVRARRASEPWADCRCGSDCDTWLCGDGTAGSWEVLARAVTTLPDGCRLVSETSLVSELSEDRLGCDAPLLRNMSQWNTQEEC